MEKYYPSLKLMSKKNREDYEKHRNDIMLQLKVGISLSFFDEILYRFSQRVQSLTPIQNTYQLTFRKTTLKFYQNCIKL
jgi:hypothetical protein